jgi:hypothetical protein
MKAQEQMRREMEASQQKMEADALKRRNMHRRPNNNESDNRHVEYDDRYRHSSQNSQPHHGHEYRDIPSPLKDALQQQQQQHQESYGRNPPPHVQPHHQPQQPLTDSIDYQMQQKQYPQSEYQYNSMMRDSQDSHFSHHNRGGNHPRSNYPPSGYGYNDRRRGGDDRNEPYNQSSACNSYDRGYDDDPAFDLSLVAETRLVEPDSSGLLVDILPRKGHAKNLPSNVGGHGFRRSREGGAIDLEQSLTSASTFVYLGEQSVDLPGSSRPKSSAVRPISQQRDPANMPPAGRPTSATSSAAPSSSPSYNNSSMMTNIMKPTVAGSLAAQHQQQPIAVIPATRVVQQAALPAAHEVPDNRRFIRSNNNNSDNLESDMAAQWENHNRAIGVSDNASHHSTSSSHLHSTTSQYRPLADPVSLVQPSHSSSAIGDSNNPLSRPSSSSGVQYRSKFAQELFANPSSFVEESATNSVAPTIETERYSDNYSNSRPSSQSKPAAKRPGGWDVNNRDNTVRQLQEHSSSIAALLSGQYAPKEVERPTRTEKQMSSDMFTDPDLLMSDEEMNL